MHTHAASGAATDAPGRPDLDPVLRALTGLGAAEFAELAAALDGGWQAERAVRLAGRAQRMRAPGAGRPPISFPARLLLALVRLRWDVSCRSLAGCFAVSKDTVRRVEAELRGLLARDGRPGWRPPAPSGELAAVIAALGPPAVLAAFAALASAEPKPRINSRTRTAIMRRAYFYDMSE